jgi:hypothetical protein
MPPARQVTDALWHCLCPSFARSTLTKPQILRRRTLPLQARRHASTSPQYIADDERGRILSRDPKDVPLHQSYYRLVYDRPATKSHDTYFTDSGMDSLAEETRTKAARLGLESVHELALYRKYKTHGVAALYETLQKRANNADHVSTRVLVKMLVEARGEEMGAPLYLALILANASHTSGSAGEVERLLRDMTADEVPMESDVLHAALRV